MACHAYNVNAQKQKRESTREHLLRAQVVIVEMNFHHLTQLIATSDMSAWTSSGNSTIIQVRIIAIWIHSTQLLTSDFDTSSFISCDWSMYSSMDRFHLSLANFVGISN
ncbi:hypothetical protein M758_1G215200 [Ceratodon purpureus]|nr:hypothetical protein M758_1G215200 [Ceratodon purpureus]